MTVLLLLHACGGRVTADPSSAAAGGKAALGSADPDECAGGASDGGCGGEAGAGALEHYARLRTACGRRTQVSRDDPPVSICYRIR